MAEFGNRFHRFLNHHPVGIVISAFVYVVMLLLVMMFFTGHGQFIYEAF